MRIRNIFLSLLVSTLITFLGACNRSSTIDKDIFSKLNINFIGVNGEGELQFNEDLEEIVIEIDKQFGLSNGDEVTVKIIKNQAVDEKKIIVNGLHEYITKDDISKEFIDEIRDYYYALLAPNKASDDFSNRKNVRLNEVYFSSKEEHFGAINQLTLYFETTEFSDKENKETTKYWAADFINLTKNSYGKIELSASDYDELREVNNVEKEIKSILENQYYETYEIKQ